MVLVLVLVPVPVPQVSYNLAASGMAVWTDGTRAEPLVHLAGIDGLAHRALEEWRMVVMAKLHIDQVLFPADRAVGNVLSAH